MTRPLHLACAVALFSGVALSTGAASGDTASAASALNQRAAHLARVDLISCRGKRIAEMPRSLLRSARKELGPRDRRETSTAMAPPPRDAYLTFGFSGQPNIYGQLIYDHTLHVAWSPPCGPLAKRTERAELSFDSERLRLYEWLERLLGPTQAKEYQVPKDVRPPPAP